MPFPEVIRSCARDIIEVPMLIADGRYVFDLEGIDAAIRRRQRLGDIINEYQRARGGHVIDG
jgi:bifunctional pyridoxal-dependent enzyme with beta-cystathionase and maltose regulon repressor activities